jgi:hypothetical protein
MRMHPLGPAGITPALVQPALLRPAFRCGLAEGMITTSGFAIELVQPLRQRVTAAGYVNVRDQQQLLRFWETTIRPLD